MHAVEIGAPRGIRISLFLKKTCVLADVRLSWPDDGPSAVAQECFVALVFDPVAAAKHWPRWSL